MNETPDPGWETSRYREWLEPGFTRLVELRAEAPPWDSARAEFLASLGTDDGEIAATPALGLLWLVLSYFDRDLSGDDERWSVIAEPVRWAEIVDRLADPYVHKESLAWLAGSAPRLVAMLGSGTDTVDRVRRAMDAAWPDWHSPQVTEETVTTWVTGQVLPPVLAAAVADLVWMTASQRDTLNTLGGTWPEDLRAWLDEQWPGWREQVDAAVLSGWLDDAMPAFMAQAVPAESAGHASAAAESELVVSAAAAATDAVTTIGASALSEALRLIPEAAAMSPERLRELLGAELTAQLATNPTSG